MGKQKSDRKSRFCQDVIPKHNRMSNQNTNKIVQLFWWPFGGPSKSLAELYERRVVNFSVIERWSISYLLCHLHVHFQEELILKSWSPVLQLTAFQVERQVYGNMWHQFAWCKLGQKLFSFIFLQLIPLLLLKISHYFQGFVFSIISRVLQFALHTHG